MAPIKRIGILTGGGDAPGLNAVIRAVVKTACNSGIECVGLEDSFDGLLELDRSRVLTPRDVTGILRLGGTILGTLNTGNPFDSPVATSDGPRLYGERVIEMFHKMGLDALVVIGGDGTLAIAHQFGQRGIPIVGVPKTIDNDIVGTTNCFGFDTAVAFATDAIDRLHTTAEAHHRIMVVEVMGRYAGMDCAVCRRRRRRGRDSDSGDSVRSADRRRPAARARSLGRQVQHRRRRRRRVPEGRQDLARRGGQRCARRAARRHRRAVCAALGELTGKETRSVVLGHLQRGGAPTSFDRVLATRFGGKAVELVKRRASSARWSRSIRRTSSRGRLEDVVGKTKTVPMDFDLLLTARALGVTFGELRAEGGWPRRSELAAIGRRFYARGWALGTSGNFSAVVSRTPLRLAITASSVAKGALRASDILQCDERGRVVGRRARKAVGRDAAARRDRQPPRGGRRLAHALGLEHDAFRSVAVRRRARPAIARP